MGKRPDGTISMVVPTYGVQAYLPEFLDSLTRQRGPVDAVQLVFVDDGSPDDSAAIIAAWIETNPRWAARLVRQANGGLSAARNAGLDVATGEWVTFPDPDDVLGEGYVASMLALAGSPEALDVDLIAGRFIYLDDGGATSDTHPLRYRFAAGSRVVDLTQHPRHIHVAANAGLFRRALIEQHALRYDPAVAPVWEDGHLTARYLSKIDSPRIAFRADAIYYYRRRSDGSSLMDGQWAKRGRFLDVPRGWLDAMQIAADRHGGRVPPWLQNMILYDMTGYLKQDLRMPSPTASTPREVSDEFLEIVAEVMDYIDLARLDGYAVNEVAPEILLALRMHFKHADPRPVEVHVDGMDRGRGLVRVRYVYVGTAPVEQFRCDGQVTSPAFATTTPRVFYGVTFMTERAVWLPSDARLEVELDGRAVPLRFGPPRPPVMASSADELWTGTTGEPARKRPRPVDPGLRSAITRTKRRLREAGKSARLSSGPARSHVLRAYAATAPRYRGAWLLMDRVSLAQDNAEHLYRYLRREHPDVPTFFVLSRTSSDWSRLAADGFALIEHGSLAHKLALRTCAHVLSSRIGRDVVGRVRPNLFGPSTRSWRFTHLQSGVTPGDRSIELNQQAVDRMITAATAEYAAIVADTSRYLVGDHEVRLTGFPRHDRLLELGRAAPARDLIVVRPTWRRDPEASDYVARWRAVLASSELAVLAAEHGLHIAYVMHPSMGDVEMGPLPDHVQRHDGDTDVQPLLARAAVFVTDYSSTAFEAAYLQRPVVYFQFDREVFFSGGQSYRKGTWSYVEDGFGPVVDDAGAAVEAIIDTIRAGSPDPRYAQRMAEAFPFRDGRCAQRTYEAVLDLTRPVVRA